MVIYVVGDISKEDLVKAREDYGDYIKVVADVVTGKMTIGGEWHADGEKILLELGSRQKDLWGGGIDMKTGRVETIALINLRPESNTSQDILDSQVRNKFTGLVSDKFELWTGNKH